MPVPGLSLLGDSRSSRPAVQVLQEAAQRQRVEHVPVRARVLQAT
jgi:hypothetical protein